MARFEGKAIVVTGATSGIGRAVALAFAGEGATVIAAGRDAARGKDVEDAARAAGGTCIFYPSDIRQEADVEALARFTLDNYGSIAAAVNTVGINPHGPIYMSSIGDFEAMFDTNVKGVFLCFKHFILAMKETGGAIVNVGSMAAERPLANRALYGASKSAAAMLVRAAAVEAAQYGIRINEIAPGTIDTPMLRDTWAKNSAGPVSMEEKVSGMIPLRRLGRPEEIAAAILFLCSDEGAYVTGARLTIDGGLILTI